MSEQKSKSVTLYLDEDVIEKLNAFAAVTHRSKSNAANHLILHGIANYDVRAAAPKKVVAPKKATKANTRVKQPPAVKTPTAKGRKAPVAVKRVNTDVKPKAATRKRKPAAAGAKKAA